MRVAITGTQVSPTSAGPFICAAATRHWRGSTPPCNAAGLRINPATWARRTPADPKHHVHDAAGFVAAVERACNERGPAPDRDPRAGAVAGRPPPASRSRPTTCWNRCAMAKAPAPPPPPTVYRARLPAGERLHPQAGIDQRLRRLPPPEQRPAFGAVPDLRPLPLGDRTGRRQHRRLAGQRRAALGFAFRRRPWKCDGLCAKCARPEPIPITRSGMTNVLLTGSIREMLCYNLRSISDRIA